MATFKGFPQAGLDFLAGLSENNNRAWFEANRDTYEKQMLEPTNAFIETLGQRLQTIVPAINYDTASNGRGSMFRMNRDIRFSKDKSPFKTNVNMVFWQGEGKKKELPGFYLRIDPRGSDLFAGLYGLPNEKFDSFRAAVDDPKQGPILEKIVNDLMKMPAYEVGSEAYKKVPEGYPADHPRADLLRLKTLHVNLREDHMIPPSVIVTPNFVDAAFEHFERMAPFQQWVAHMYFGN